MSLASSRKDLVNDPTEVSVAGGDGSLDISTAHGLLSLALPAGVSLEPGSCVQTAACDEELHFRMRINVDQSTDDGNLHNNGPLAPTRAHQTIYIILVS